MANVYLSYIKNGFNFGLNYEMTMLLGMRLLISKTLNIKEKLALLALYLIAR